MSQILAFVNQKGGVGKTTSCVNIAAALAQLKQRVLLIDLDPQGNATMGSGVNKSSLTITSKDLLLESKEIDEIIVESKSGYSLIPANADLTAAEIQLVNTKDKQSKLVSSLRNIKNKYDFILLDCPPSLNMLTLNALVAATGLIIPMQCEYYALEGLSSLLATIAQIKQELNPNIQITGIVKTMFDARNKLSLEVSEQLELHFPNKVFSNAVPRNVRVAEAPSYGAPVVTYDKSSKGAKAYIGIAKEILGYPGDNTGQKVKQFFSNLVT